MHSSFETQKTVKKSSRDFIGGLDTINTNFIYKAKKFPPISPYGGPIWGQMNYIA